MTRATYLVLAFLIAVIASQASAQTTGPVRQWAVEAFASSQYTDGSWSARQATGAPNSDRDGDQPTAWAPKDADGTTEWIELIYKQTVVPSAVNVRETFNPGFVKKIEAYSYGNVTVMGGRLPEDAGGKWALLWAGRDETTESPSTFSPPLNKVAFATNRIRITIDTSEPGWEEIDAVELVGGHPQEAPTGGLVSQWAFGATASSQYGTTDWSARQATGAPDTQTDGDISTAWAPANFDGTTEWLELTYARPVVPTSVRVRETFNPGFVTRIDGFSPAIDDWVVLWEGEDPTNESPGTFEPELTGNDFRTDRIRVTINTDVPGWNEIDAVELIGRIQD